MDALHACRDSINAIEVDRLRVKPVIKITGEFWAQTTEGDGNFNMFAFLEKEGAQVLVEPIATWIAYMMYVAKEGAKARADAEAPYRDPKWYEVKKRFANEFKVFKKTGGLSAGSVMWNHFYHRTIRHMGDTAHHLIPQKELVAAGASLLPPARARRRRLHGSRQERLLHRESSLPHGAGAQALRLHALDAIGRCAIAGGQQIQRHDLPARSRLPAKAKSMPTAACRWRWQKPKAKARAEFDGVLAARPESHWRNCAPMSMSIRS